jgi:hypothetical protein
MSAPNWDDIAMQALSDKGAMCGDCGDQPGDRICPDCERCRRWYVAALRDAGWAPRTETLNYAATEAENFASGPIEEIALGAFANDLRRKARRGLLKPVSER